MNYEGRDVQANAADLAGILSPKWVVRHRGSTADYIKRYRMLAADAAKQQLAGLKALAPSLLNIISDERSLFAAWRHMAAHGGTAPGPDGCRYDEFTVNEVWKWCRATRDEIRAGEYTPGEESVQRIPKSSGAGFRELVLQSIFDRVVQRAAVEIFQPLLDPLFYRRSFGYRPKKGTLRALATAELLYRGGKRGVWVSVDIRNAFPSVPIVRLLGVLRKYLPDESLLALIEAMTRPDKRPGLRQGSPLSPLLLNLYLHHLLDRKWRELNPKIPLLRFADDILLLCRTEQQARDAYAALAKLLREAGFELKESEKDAIRLVSVGQEVKWMGFGISGSTEGLRFAVVDDAWEGLTEKFATAHRKPNSPIAAIRSIAGWLADKAPCFPFTNVDKAYGRIKHLAAAHGFEEIPHKGEVAGLWQRAYARWCKLRKKVAGP